MLLDWPHRQRQQQQQHLLILSSFTAENWDKREGNWNLIETSDGSHIVISNQNVFFAKECVNFVSSLANHRVFWKRCIIKYKDWYTHCNNMLLLTVNIINIVYYLHLHMFSRAAEPEFGWVTLQRTKPQENDLPDCQIDLKNWHSHNYVLNI